MEGQIKRKLKGAEKKAETIRLRQEAQKKKLIEILKESPNTSSALNRVGIDRSTFSRWKADNREFFMQVCDAVSEGIERTADNVELSLLNGARNGDVRAQKFYLEHNHQRYKPSRNILERDIGPLLTNDRLKKVIEMMNAWRDPYLNKQIIIPTAIKKDEPDDNSKKPADDENEKNSKTDQKSVGLGKAT
jgi:hypothetical protein